MLNAHLTDVEEVHDLMFIAEIAALLTLDRGRDILVRYKVVEDDGDLFFVEDVFYTKLLKLADRHRGRNVVAQYPVQLRHHQLARHYMVETGMRRQNLLGHCHSHRFVPPYLMLMIAPLSADETIAA